MKGKISKLLKIDSILRFCTFLMVLYYGISLSSMVLNMAVVNLNTDNLKYDFTVSRVDYLDGAGNVVLYNGTIVGSDEIKRYIKVDRGSGTWYNEEEKCLIVEITNNDVINIISGFITIGVFMILVLLYMILIRKDNSILIKFVSILFTIFTLIGSYFTISLF